MGTSSFVSLIVNLHPSEANYEESLSSLQFAERTKITPVKGNTSNAGQMMGGATPSSAGGAGGGGGSNNGQSEEFMMQNMGNYAGNDKLVKSLKDQIKDLETKVEFIQRVNRARRQAVS